MILTSLELTDFRNYNSAYIEFGDKKNFLIGNNAQGKTNILEAIYLLCLSRSFRTSYEKEAIGFSKPHFTIKGSFKLDSGIVQTLIFHCSQQKGKQITLNRKRLSRTSELIGKFPVVLSSPDEYILTIGPPPGRRKFVDILLSQINKKYFLYLQDYYRIIKQRNTILSSWKISGVKSISMIEPWDQRLVDVGSRILTNRKQFTSSFSEILNTIHLTLGSKKEQLRLTYRPNITLDNDDENKIQSSFLNQLKQTRHREIQRGISLIGPHRDDFIFSINGKELRKYGSRGQHKTVLLSLAMAQFDLIKEKMQEVPIILIDDLYSEIDQDREAKIIETLNQMGQVFITTTQSPGISNIKNDDNFYLIEDGKISNLNLSK